MGDDAEEVFPTEADFDEYEEEEEKEEEFWLKFKHIWRLINLFN